MIKWEEELTKRGFICLCSSVKCWGNGEFTGSITDEGFRPFAHDRRDKYNPRLNYETIILRDLDELNRYLYGT